MPNKVVSREEWLKARLELLAAEKEFTRQRDALTRRRMPALSTMAVVGRLVGTFEPAREIVTMAQANSASARTNTIAPSQPAGRSAGRNRKGTSQSTASPAMTASPYASGGRTMT